MNISQETKAFNQRYYRNNNNLGLCRTVLLSDNFESEHFAAEEIVQKKVLMEKKNLNLFRPVLLSGNIQTQHVAAGEGVQKNIVSEH